ncbi:MAG: AI-2E family transporter [Sphingobacteriales bacterium]|nr:MAG: AI-2E family transporter [Sphingobacteriales bacterium]
MNFSLKTSLQRLLFLYLLFAGLYYAKPFLVPVVFAALLSMLMLPLARKLEQRMNKALSSFICISLLLLLVAGMVTLLSWQVADLAGNTSKMEQQVTSMITQAKQQISTTLGIPPEKQQEMIKKQQQSGGGKISGMITTFLSSFAGILGSFVLVLVYIFLFIYYRSRLKSFLFAKTPDLHRDEVKDMVGKSQKVAGKYISGLALMIVCLWVLYGIGFSIVGVKHALFFAILCGILEIVPFIGNLVGTALTALMAMAQGGSPEMLIGVLVTYAVVQTFQSYVLEPLIVGSNVNINPLFTIMAIVLGEIVWGVAGMVLAIPLLAITKIVCDHMVPLHPYGYLFGEDKKTGSGNKWIEKLKSLVGKKE